THQFSPSLATTQTPTLSTAAFGAAADANGNVIVVGLTGGNLFETTDYHGFADCFVTKFDGTGKELWTKLIGGAGDDFCNAVTVDNSGNVFVTGQIDSAPTTTAGNNDVFVAKFDPSGNQQWLTQYGTSATDSGTAIAVDTSGNTYVVGYTLGTFASNTSAGSEDAFITKLDGTGTIIKTNQGGSPDTDLATAIAIDNTSGMIYVAGTTYGSVGTPANIDSTGNSSDIFVVKFDSSLANPLATWQIGSAPTGVVSAVTGSLIMPNDTAQGIAVDAAGNVFVTGSTNGVFPGNTNAGGYDSVVIKFQPATGTVEWYQQLGTTGDDNGSAIVMDNKGNALVTGTTDGNFDGIQGFGLSDVFLMSYDANGVKY
nr:SBBP repeat-containing protein [Nitrospiraceae bacterium]